jgi:hypothetical protein
MSLNLANNHNHNHNNELSNVYNVVEGLQDYMFTRPNIERYTKNILKTLISSDQNQTKYVAKEITIRPNTNIKSNSRITTDNLNLNFYKPLKKDSLFWCFFILKYGFGKYEMDIGSQHFIIEKTEKYNNIELLRTKENKNLLKINKIKVLSDLEDDLANKERISIKTFFALCIIEKINILLVDGRKIYQSINNDNPLINVIHRNNKTYEHHIELNVSNDAINNYRQNYYNVSGFDGVLKSMSAYKVDELIEICKQLNINTDINTALSNKSNPKKLTKKDLYELIVQNF